jgi:hypothetical protein
MKTRAERLFTVEEIRRNCIAKELTKDLGTKVLFAVLDDYLEKGTIYLEKELRIIGNSSPALRNSAPCKYVLNLYNDRAKTDTVVIRAYE